MSTYLSRLHDLKRAVESSAHDFGAANVGVHALETLERDYRALWSAEYAARRIENQGNEGDADAIRRDALRSFLGLGIEADMHPTPDSQESHRAV